MKKDGRDRRVHTVYLTRNREYHTRSRICVAVRDRRTGVWMADHEAVGMELVSPAEAEMVLGARLTFASLSAEVLTSHVVDILRPCRTTVDTYGLVLSVRPDGSTVASMPEA